MKISATVRNAAVLLVAALMMGGCIAPLRMPQDNTLMKGSTSTGSLGRKPVNGKREPAYLIAVDGTECTVSKKKFKKVKVGDAVFCLWSSPAQGF